MADTSIRIDEAVAAPLTAEAHQRGVSLNRLASEILQRHVAVGPVDEHRPLMLPVGLSKDLDGISGPQRHGWLLLYQDASGLPIVVTGRLARVTPMFVDIEIEPGSGGTLTVPRAALLGWERLDEFTEFDILRRAAFLQRWGAFLHERVQISGREVNGVYFPPRQWGGPAAPAPQPRLPGRRR